MAPRRRRGKKGGFESLIPPVEEAVVQALRQSAVQIMNDLSEKGPAYSGQFSSAWYTVSTGQSAGGPRAGEYQLSEPYKYDLRNVPKTKFKKVRQNSYFEIVNTMSYAPQALDLEPGDWRQPEEEPIKKPVNRGSRTGDMRYEVEGQEKKGAVSTAKANWYNTYIQGGAFKKSFERGVKLGFRQSSGGF